MRRIKIGILFLLLAPCALLAQEIVLKGNVSDPHGNALPNALVQLIAHNHVVSQSKSGADGRFLLKVSSTGEFVQVLPPSLECETVGTMFDSLESMILSGNALSGVCPVCTNQEQSAEGQPATDRFQKQFVLYGFIKSLPCQ
jgi:hypothetical protein